LKTGNGTLGVPAESNSPPEQYPAAAAEHAVRGAVKSVVIPNRH